MPDDAAILATLRGERAPDADFPAARDAWLNMVATLEIEVLAPQHGPILKGDAVKRFLDWFRALDIGSGLAAYAGARR